MFKFAAILLSTGVLATEHDPEAIKQQIAEMPITCSSSLRIGNIESHLYLNSGGHNYREGSGSSEGQIVTTVSGADSYDSMF
jgi:hypothetical protein